MNDTHKLWSILSPAERLSALCLFGWMLLGMALEMLGIGIVVPALALMVGGTDRALPWGAIPWREWFGSPSQSRVLLVGVISIAGVFVVKTAVLLYINWQQQRFVATLQADLSRRLFSAYIRQPWPFHLQRNSATLIHNLENVTGITESVGWALVLVAECLVLGGIGMLLAWCEPVGAVGVAAVTGAATLLLERGTRHRMLRCGRLQQQHAAQRVKFMHEGLHGVKESLVHGRHAMFLEQFAEASSAYAWITAEKSFIAKLPRLWYELVAVTSLCVLVGIMAAEGRSTRAMVPVLGLFAAAAFRILPSVNRLAFALHTLRFTTPAVESLNGELVLERTALPAASAAVPPTFAREILVEGVCYCYPDGVDEALAGVDMRIPRGAAVGLVGGSGAGKSTLVDVILGLLPPTVGRVSVDGVDVATNLPGWQQLVGYVPQSIYLTDDSIRRNVAFGVPREAIDDGAVRRALRAARIDEFVDSLPQGVETAVGERGVRLSGGQRQRIGIARALYHDPAVLVLDEATSALDLDTERQIMDAIEALHGVKTVIVVAHRDSTVARCDLVYRLEGGTLSRALAAQDAVPG